MHATNVDEALLETLETLSEGIETVRQIVSDQVRNDTPSLSFTEYSLAKAGDQIIAARKAYKEALSYHETVALRGLEQ